MASTATIPTQAVLVGLRLHVPRGDGTAPGRAEQLLALEARAAQQAAATAALREFALACRSTVEALPAQVAERLDQVTGLAVELGLQLARELVGEALQQGLVDPTATVLRCLRDCVHGSDRADLVVRLHPADLDIVQPALAALPEIQEELGAARLLADASVPRGGVRAETGAGRLHYDPREVLERICAEVRREASA